MKATNNNPSKVLVIRNLVLALAFFTLFTSCTKELPEYEGKIPPIRIGEYQIQENSELEDLHYNMGVHWIADLGEGYIEFCNFNNRKIHVKATLHNDKTFSLPMQDFTSDFEEFQIYQGSGIFNLEGFELKFWGRMNGTAVTSSLLAKYPQ